MERWWEEWLNLEVDVTPEEIAEYDAVKVCGDRAKGLVNSYAHLLGGVESGEEEFQHTMAPTLRWAYRMSIASYKRQDSKRQRGWQVPYVADIEPIIDKTFVLKFDHLRVIPALVGNVEAAMHKMVAVVEAREPFKLKADRSLHNQMLALIVNEYKNFATVAKKMEATIGVTWKEER